jgi:hypothetical protein
VGASQRFLFASTPRTFGVGRQENEEVKSMDRLNRVIAGAGLAIVLGMVVSAGGCRSARNDVPPGKPYSVTGGTPPTVGFSSDPHASTSIGPGMYNNMPGQANATDPSAGMPGAASGASAGFPAQYGTPAPNSTPYGAPTANRYGPPATTSGAGQ